MKDELIDILGDECPVSETDRLKWCRMLSEKEWKLSQQLLQLLAYSHAPMTSFQNNDSPTLSLVAPLVVAVIKNSRTVRDGDTIAPAVRKVASSIIRGVKDRFAPILNNAIYSVATFVDPFGKSWFPQLPSHIQGAVRSFISKTALSLAPPPTPQKETLSQFSDTSLGQMLPCTPWGQTVNFDIDAYIIAPAPSPVDFIAKQPIFIQELYLAVCGIPASSSEIERLFSTCGNVNSKLRCSLKPENVERRSLLKKNGEKIESYRLREVNYPASTPKLRNWIAMLPTLSQPFFHNDADDGEIEIDDDYVDEGVDSEISDGEQEEEVIDTDLQGDGYWNVSKRPKNFAKQVAVLKPGSKRKRSNADKSDEDDAPARKRRKTDRFILLKRPPMIGNTVYVHFTLDCTCQIEDHLKCTCDLWYRGKVTSESENNKEGNRVFAVLFIDGEEEEIEWKIEGRNSWWAIPAK